MQLPNGIEQHGTGWRIRIRVPRDVKVAVGRDLIRETIKETDHHKAIEAGLSRIAELTREWNAIRSRGQFTPALRARATAEFFNDAREYEGQQTALLPPDHMQARAAALIEEIGDDLDNILRPGAIEWLTIAGASDFEKDRRQKLAQSLRNHLVRSEPGPVGWFADEFIARERIDAPRGSSAYRDLCLALTRAWLRSLDATAQPEPVPLKVAKAEPTITEAFEQFARANPYGVKRDTLDYSRECIGLFAQSVPAGATVAQINKAAVREWLDLLLQMPVQAANAKAFQNMTIRQAVEANKTVGKPTISRKTINKYLSALGSLCRWLESRDQIPNNPTTGLYFRLAKRKGSPEPFTVAELQTLFTSTEFRAPRDDWRYWLPLLALFSGARMSEIGQLLVADVRRDHGRWTFHFTEYGDDEKTLKTATSTRVVPVHPELERLGFLEFVRRLDGRGERRLFPDLERFAR